MNELINVYLNTKIRCKKNIKIKKYTKRIKIR